jgi:membrane protein
LVEFFSDLKSILELSMLKSVGRKLWDDDCLGLAGQLAYFILLSLFPFLMFLVAVASLVVNDPESALKTSTERMEGFLPQDAVGLLVDYVDRTLRSTTSGVLLFSILAALSAGSAAAGAIIKATNRAYDLRETRPFWNIQGISVLMALGLVLLIAALALVVFGPGVGGYVQRLTGLPNVFLDLWRILRWGLAFLAVTFALDILYYVAPNADLPFKWITPGGVAATVLTLISSVALKLYVANFGRYDEIYGQLGAVIVLMLWLYITGLMVLIGAEINAVIVRKAEEPLGTELIQAGTPADKSEA